MMVSREELQEWLYQGNIIAIEQAFSGNEDWNKELLGVYLCLEIFHLEVKREEKTTIFDYSLEIDELVRHVYYVKLLLRRFEFAMPEPLQEEAYQYILRTGVSDSMIFYLMNYNLFYRKTFAEHFARTAAAVEGGDSLRAAIYTQIGAQLEEDCYE